ncbi:MAG: hypothetical protein M0004_03165 [Actinomycetota bacterium]|nr:hypothetical protein [Actinomycetota bacterium]
MPSPPDDASGADPQPLAEPATTPPGPPSAASVTYLNHRLARAAAWIGIGAVIFCALGALASSAILLSIAAAEAALAIFLLATRWSFQHKYLPGGRPKP